MRFFLFSTSPRKYPVKSQQQLQQQDSPTSEPTDVFPGEDIPHHLPPGIATVANVLSDAADATFTPLLASLSSASAAIEAPFSRSVSTIFPLPAAAAENTASTSARPSSSDEISMVPGGLRQRSRVALRPRIVDMMDPGLSSTTSTDTASTSNTSDSTAAGTPGPDHPRTQSLTDLLLARLEYNTHSPESLDWFNVLLAQIINQYRSDARANGRLATVLNDVLNGPKKPDYLDEIKLTELSTGEDFPIFSNCRVHKRTKTAVAAATSTAETARASVSMESVSAAQQNIETSAQQQQPQHSHSMTGTNGTGGSTDVVAEMDVDLSDTITMGIETRVLLRQPRIFATVMPVSLVVSIVRFSARMILRISRITVDSATTGAEAAATPAAATSTTTPAAAAAAAGNNTPPAPQKNTMLVLRISFHPDFTLEVAVKSLLGSRSMLHDMPRIGHIIEGQLRKWFSDNFVEPGYKQIVLFRYQSDIE